MNCFEWNSRASDYLDGALIGSAKEADDHLESCPTCNDRSEHYRVILNSIASQPRSALPIPIRKSPFSPVLSRIEVGGGTRRLSRSQWQRVPWPIRTSIEGMSIVLLVLLGISTGPKLRSLYERRMESNLEKFNDILPENEIAGAVGAPPLARGKTVAMTTDLAAPVEDEVEGDDDSSGESAESDDANDSNIRVGSSEMWRFNLKTDSPHALRTQIVEALTELKVPDTTPGFAGIEVPGGIQFDLLVSQSAILNLKKQLQKLAPPAPAGLADSPMGETFTWFKVKSKRQIPSGQARVVIWLSQM